MIMAAALAACRRGETPAPKPPETKSASTNVGDAMPPYAAKTLEGAPFDLAAEKGKVVLVNVWATWCGPCRFEIPELQKMHDQYAARGFKVIGVSVDEGDAAGVKQFVADQKMTYPIVLDPEGRIANLLQTMVLPTSVLVDRSGKIVWRQVGALSPGDAKLTKAIDAALGAGRS
jgi:thiol-disulfide isomerase/thioredoxin